MNVYLASFFYDIDCYSIINIFDSEDKALEGINCYKNGKYHSDYNQYFVCL